MPLRRRFVITLVALAIASLTQACGGSKGSSSADGTAEPNTVILKNVVFKPAKLTVKAGTTVTWKWEDGSVQHNVAFADYKSEIQTSGEYTHTFDTAGTFKYKCDVHPTTMLGTVTVS